MRNLYLQQVAFVASVSVCISCGRLGYELVARPGEVGDADVLEVRDVDDGRRLGDVPGTPDLGDGGQTTEARDVADAPRIQDAAVFDAPPANPCVPPTFMPLRAVTAGCPANYALVPGRASTGIGHVEHDFCAPRFEMKAVNNQNMVVLEGRATGKPEQLALASHHPESRPDGKPWRFISQKQAKAECAALGPAFHLMTNDEWMTIALQLEASTWTWSGCTLGMGNLPTGFGGVPVSDTNDPYSDTGATAATPWGQGGEKRRALSLMNGEVIWDFNRFAEWLDVTSNGSSVTLSVQAGDGTDSSEALVYAFDSDQFLQVLARSYGDTQVPPRFIALDTKMILPATAMWNGTRWVGATRERGFGQFIAKKEYRTSKALMRGWDAMFDFSVYEYDGFDTWDAVGFRCVRDLP